MRWHLPVQEIFRKREELRFQQSSGSGDVHICNVRGLTS